MILDYVDNYSIEEKDLSDFYEHRMALARLSDGLLHIFNFVRDHEKTITEKAIKDDIQLTVVGELLDDLPLGELSSMFQWYSISACNYAQLVGWIAFQDSLKAKDYARSVIPKLVNFRNKISAHFAITDPRDDNVADLAASIMTQVIFARGKICAAALTPIIKEGENVIKVSKDLSWSLTSVHNKLISRYWPEGYPKSFQSIKVPPGKSSFNVSFPDIFD